MTIEQHLRHMIGDLVLTVARLSAELDALLAATATPPPAAAPTRDAAAKRDDKAGG